ncbi:hypothetical protein CM318V1_1590007 [Carnobacterium maltaromaticum]|uniref:hypothetical protein n=1 Tax=Carnobacterium maltaromaticum TaxID=2751 RepID=UPI0007054A6C|nr:hypothetical protein [Carnobacterium maltaromaticum]KRN70636.1 hypothetical protein IV76_GL001676 [Carnobacterium maltaromaticum]CRH17698.1 hypothetical protein CM318V1_1590007 [Carnobacterium maltaromaticum]
MAKAWTEKDDDYLLAHYKDKSLMQLADNLNRSVKAIQSRLRTLGALNKHEKKEKKIYYAYPIQIEKNTGFVGERHQCSAVLGYTEVHFDGIVIKEYEHSVLVEIVKETCLEAFYISRNGKAVIKKEELGMVV